MNSLRQRGAVLIMVLWTAVVLTVLVTVMASSIRLSANTARNHREGVQGFANVMDAMHKAEMELMLELMPMPVGALEQEQDLSEYRMPAYRFNGQPLTLHYAAAENMVVRIYEHAGKININRIQRQRLQELIETRLGENHDPRQVQELLAAWTDWVDLNDQTTPVGAESDYYRSLDPPYEARNNPEFESVEEMRLIRGFNELFADVNLDAAFTVYGTGNAVNPNYATREALMLLPGMDADIVERILALREQEDIRTMQQISDIVPLEQWVRLSPWLGLNSSGFFSVYAYPRLTPADSDQDSGNNPELAEDPVTHSYMQVMQVRTFQTRARIYQVHPYARLPDTAPARVDD
jgi:general secretion pathway protein K